MRRGVLVLCLLLLLPGQLMVSAAGSSLAAKISAAVHRGFPSQPDSVDRPSPTTYRDSVVEHWRLAAASGGTDAGGDGSDLGLGSSKAPAAIAHAPACAPIHAFLFSESFGSGADPKTNILTATRSVLPAGILGPGFVRCDGSVRAEVFDKLVLNATPALATCDDCARATSQLWLESPAGAMHVNDFRYLVFRGEGFVEEFHACWAGDLCILTDELWGDGAVLQLTKEPPTCVDGAICNEI